MSWRKDPSFSRKVATYCCDFYDKEVGKTGKPQAGKEWTLLACVVVSIDRDEGSDIRIVSLGTGSKCLGQSKLSEKGDVVHDSHAEIIARRGFLRYLYGQLQVLVKGGTSDTLELDPDVSHFSCRLKTGVSFHMFTSHTPCGDASIFPKSTTSDEYGAVVAGLEESDKNVNSDKANNKRTFKHGSMTSEEKKTKYVCTNDSQENLQAEERETVTSANEEDGFYRTGTKTVPGDMEDPHVPEKCGDASICPKSTTSDESGMVVPSLEEKSRLVIIEKDTNKRPLQKESRQCEEKKTKYLCTADSRDNKQAVECDTVMSVDKGDIYRTGAKTVPGDMQDPHAPGKLYHVCGVLRTKPGRGDRTLSLSCSDKFARWTLLGIQGALLSHFFTNPLYLSSVIVGKCPYNKEAMYRAVVGRLSHADDLPPGYQITAPLLYQEDVTFSASRCLLEGTCDKPVPASSAVIWWMSENGCPVQEASVNGLRQGITAKNRNRPNARVSVCKLEIFRCYLNLIEDIQKEKLPPTIKKEAVTYLDHKNSAVPYQRTWTNLTSNTFKHWPRTIDCLKKFTLES